MIQDWVDDAPPLSAGTGFDEDDPLPTFHDGYGDGGADTANDLNAATNPYAATAQQWQQQQQAPAPVPSMVQSAVHAGAAPPTMQLRCAYIGQNGSCIAPIDASTGATFCDHHLCQNPACTQEKSSQEQLCTDCARNNSMLQWGTATATATAVPSPGPETVGASNPAPPPPDYFSASQQAAPVRRRGLRHGVRNRKTKLDNVCVFEDKLGPKHACWFKANIQVCTSMQAIQ
jgi:hypothetical protein